MTDKPTVLLKMSEESESINYGTTITLKAEITAYPAPSSIQWTRINKNGKNEEGRNKSGKFFIDKSNASCPKLSIENLDFSDNGEYKITVTIAVGEAQDIRDVNGGGKYYFVIFSKTCIEMLRNFKLYFIAALRNRIYYTFQS